MILSLFHALGIDLYEDGRSWPTMMSFEDRSDTYLSLLLFGTDNAGALPSHDSHLASGKRRPLTSLSTAGDKRDGSHRSYHTIHRIQCFV